MTAQSTPQRTSAGALAGVVLSPVTGLISAVRRSRMFHPSGFVCRAEVQPEPGNAAKPGNTAERAVAEALAGPALVRWSSAWWKAGEWRDVLGCALRFTQVPLGAAAMPDDQDLLLATIQRPWTMAFSPLTTDPHDFLGNLYFGVSPFEVKGLGRIEWRLSPGDVGARADIETRVARLSRTMREGRARLRLEYAPYAGPLHRPAPEQFRALVRIDLLGPLELDQRALRFDPFRAGRGIQPVGFVHAMRRATYLASQKARPSGDGTGE